MNPEAIEAGERARQALSEFLAPAFDRVVADYIVGLQKLAANEPWAADRITKLAQAVKVANEVRAQIESIVRNGDAAAAEADRARQIGKLSTERRKVLGI